MAWYMYLFNNVRLLFYSGEKGCVVVNPILPPYILFTTFFRTSNEKGSFCENDGFSVVNPVLDLKPALSVDKISFCCESGCMVVQQDSPT